MSDAHVTSPTAAHAIALIKNEHRALARIIGAMQAWIARTRDGHGERHAELFDAMLHYVENVPDYLHHPKEDQVLFPALKHHTPEAAALIRRLEQDHARGAPLIVALRGAFHAYSEGTASDLNQLSAAVDKFADFYWDHMRKEEQQLLSLAVAHLTADEWQQVASAFGDNVDPLFGAEVATEYRRLGQCIAELTPPPLRGCLKSAAPRALAQ